MKSVLALLISVLTSGGVCAHERHEHLRDNAQPSRFDVRTLPTNSGSLRRLHPVQQPLIKLESVSLGQDFQQAAKSKKSKGKKPKGKRSMSGDSVEVVLKNEAWHPKKSLMLEASGEYFTKVELNTRMRREKRATKANSSSRRLNLEELVEGRDTLSMSSTMHVEVTSTESEAKNSKVGKTTKSSKAACKGNQPSCKRNRCMTSFVVCRRGKWRCRETPKTCKVGETCDPVDGKCKADPAVCYAGERIECGDSKIYVCSYDEVRRLYKSVCIAEIDTKNHLSSHSNDYYGMCQEETFVEKSVLKNIAPKQGLEVNELYQVEYNVSYNNNGIIALASSYNIIQAVSCKPGYVEILFSNPLSPESVPNMFPEHSILVVDGDLFGTTCDLFFEHDDQYDEPPTHNAGFLVVESSHYVPSSSTVVVTGIPTIFDVIFQEQSLIFSKRLDAPNGTERALVSLDNIKGLKDLKFSLPPDDFEIGNLKESPVQLIKDIDFSGHASIDEFKAQSLLVGEKWWQLGPQLKLSAKVSFALGIDITTTLKIKHSEESKLKFAKGKEEWHLLKGIPIPYVSWTLPGPIKTVVSKFIKSFDPEVGLFIDVPIVLSIGIKTSYKAEFQWKSSFELGEKTVEVESTINLLYPFSALFPSFKVLKSENPVSKALAPIPTPDATLAESVTFAAKLEVGFKPQLRFTTFSLTEISIGSFVGIELTGTFRTDPFPPPTDVTFPFNCDSCHHVEFDAAAIVKGLDMTYKVVGMKEPKTETILSFAFRFVFFRLCLLSLEDHFKCGKKCCEPSDTCENGECKNAFCPHECCGDDECLPGEKCSETTNKCICPLECCSDGDCKDAKVCDNASNQCRNNTDTVTKQPLNIVQIGDSYSSGGGTGDYLLPQGCYRSLDNWGYRVASSLKDRFAVRYVNRACSGDLIDTYFNRNYLGTIDCRPPVLDEVFVDIDGTTCKRFVEPQNKYITQDVDLILMTYGENEFYFQSKWPRTRGIMSCFFATSDGEECRGSVNDIHQGVSTGQYRLDLINILRDMKSRMKPGGKVILSSHPHLIMDTEYKFILSSYNAGYEIRNLAILFDNEQRTAVKEANELEGVEFAFYFDKTKELFSGHEPHPSYWHENPKRWMNEFLLIPDVYEVHHPKKEGYQRWGDAISVRMFNADLIPNGVKSTGSGANNVDLVFVIDTTSSMGSTIGSVKTKMGEIAGEIASVTQSYRMAIVTYRDFPPPLPHHGDYGDYPSRIDLPFTNHLPTIQAAINKISVAGGGDVEETVLSGINTALDMDWRSGVVKMQLVMGDAPAKIVDGKEPNSGLTVDQIIAKSKALDPVQVLVVDTHASGEMSKPGSPVASIAIGTGGSVTPGKGDVVSAIKQVLGNALRKPFGWIGENIVGRTGTPVMFDATGSFDPFGLDITSYEWDFDGDDVFDQVTDHPLTSHTYTAAFEGIALLRVTSASGTGTASALIRVDDQGSIHQPSDKYCEVDATTGLPILEDAEGNSLFCQLNTTMWTKESYPNSNVVIQNNTAFIEKCYEAIGSPMLRQQSCAVQVAVFGFVKKVAVGFYEEACHALDTVLMVDSSIQVLLQTCLEMCHILLGQHVFL